MKKYSMHYQQSGFSLIELMIVIAIIGILTALAMPAYQDYVKRTYIVEALTLAQEIKQSMATYYSETGALPEAYDPDTNLLTNVIKLPSKPLPGMNSKHIPMIPLRGQSVIAAGVLKGTLYLYFDKKSSRQGKSELEMPLRPFVMPGGQILWKCGLNAWKDEPSAILKGEVPQSQLGNNKVDPHIIPAICR